MMATDTTLPSPVAVGDRLPPDDDALFTRVRRTGRPARLESYEGTTGWLTRQLDALGYRGSVGVPISVDGRLWGAMAVLWANAAPPPGSEHRLLQFTELVATAVANAESRAELMASRARVVDASDEARRRIQRDLHDGVQQRLVALGLQARAADPAATIDQLREQLSQLSEGLTDAIDDLREVSLGIHPAILKHGGLPHAIHALARRSTVPVQVAVPDGLSLLERVEVAAYYVVAEALTNAAKHARASVVEITARTRGGSLELTIRDDGVGGATGGRGTGLVGLTDRVEALGGKIRITSPPGAGTTLRITLPLKPAADALSFDRL
jgi:signal transduction histidine kinase